MYQEVKKKMRYALGINDPALKTELTIYFEKESLQTGDEIALKRSQVKSWRKDIKAANKLFLIKGKSEKIKDRDVNNYEIKFKVGDGIGFRALENVREPYETFSGSII